MPASLSLPELAEAVTPAWLSDAVAARYPGAVAESVELLDAHSGTTGRARFRVQWRGAAVPPTALFAKLAPTDPTQRQMVVATGMGRREARFYAEVAESVPVRLPQPIWSGWNEDGSSYFMLLEDLVDSGCSFPSFRDDDGGAHARAMMDTLAALHGEFWSSARLTGELAWIEPPMRSALGPTMVGEAVKQFGDRMPPVFHDMARIYIDENDALCALLDEGPPTLAHGDCHLGNTFVDAGRVGLLDWACTCRAPAFRDVAYYLANSLATGLRREHERALLERYLEGLAAAGGEAPDVGAAWRLVRRHAVSSWVAAVVTLAAGARMQSLDVGEAATQRTNAAIEDWDTPALLREELGL